MIEFHQGDIEYPIAEISKLKLWLKKVADHYNRTIDHINYIFCSDPYLRKINRDYLKHDYYTDIITFPLSGKGELEADIYISIDRIKENALTYGQEEVVELRRVLVHGLLHLLGFDDHSAHDKALMKKEEDRWLDQYS